jgi:hypothetical protein
MAFAFSAFHSAKRPVSSTAKKDTHRPNSMVTIVVSPGADKLLWFAADRKCAMTRLASGCNGNIDRFDHAIVRCAGGAFRIILKKRSIVGWLLVDFSRPPAEPAPFSKNV